jgi:D-alanyl-D-alanine carboxypeptidase
MGKAKPAWLRTFCPSFMDIADSGWDCAERRGQMRLGKSQGFRQVLRPGRHALLVASLLSALAASSLVMSAAPASAEPRPTPGVVDAKPLTRRQLSDQVKAAEALRVDLTRSSAEVAAANARLDRYSGQANSLLANVSAARTAQVAAQTEAVAQKGRLVELGVEAQAAHDALGQLASDAYVRDGGPMGEVAAIFGALTAPRADRNTDSLATVRYLIDGRARLYDHLHSLESEQVSASARAESASTKAAAAAKTAAEAKLKLDAVINQQRTALEGFRTAQAGQVGQAAGLRGLLLRSKDPAARAADKKLREALQGQDFIHLIDDSSSCGKDAASYPNGRLPASALCPLYVAPGESLRRGAAMAFNSMARNYEAQTGSALCVADSYRSYSEQVAVKLERQGFAATPGSSQHGLGLAVDLCGGVQDFSAPAHLWMQRNAPLYGWFHPAWAEPSGVLPEPWHWEFAS